MRGGGLAALALALAALAGACGGDGGPDYLFPFQEFDDQGREHLAAGETYDLYDSDPPTTGPHAPQPAEWGVHDQPVPKEAPVHNMEHGGTVIWYNCSAGDDPLDDTACQQLRDQLAAITEEARSERKAVLMVPHPDMDHRIALTAWGILDGHDEFDGDRVRAFIEAFELRFNPENFGPGDF